MTANPTHDTASITVAPTIAELAFGTDASGCWGHDGVALSRLGPAVDVVTDDHPVEDFLGALLDDLTDDIVPDDETASVLRDAWRLAQRRTGENPPEGGATFNEGRWGGEGPVDITDVHYALRTRPAPPSCASEFVVGAGPGLVTLLPLTMQPTPRLSWALRLAANEARRAGADTVGISHLVRGLLAEAQANEMARSDFQSGAMGRAKALIR